MTQTTTVAKAAILIGVSKSIVTNMIESGQLDALIVPNKKRKTIRIYMDSIEKFKRGDRSEAVEKEAV